MIHVIGFNHHRCPISLRERVFLSQEDFCQHSQMIKTILSCSDLILLNTCNRSEIIFDGRGLDNIDIVLDWMSNHTHVSKSVLKENMYHHSNQDALAHILNVCCGLDSMLLGEQQVFGQFKKAVQQARNLGFINGDLYATCQKIYSACKHIRHSTKIHQSTISMAHAIHKLIQQHLSNKKSYNTLLIGTGETIELIANQYVPYSIGKTFIAGRTIERTKAIALKHDLQSLRIQDIPQYTDQIDIIISATASQLPIIGKGQIEKVLASQPDKKLLLFDLAVPRDIEGEISLIEGCHLYNIDDLQSQIQAGQAHRLSAANEAREMVQHEAQLLFTDMLSQGKMSPLIQFRQHMYDIQSKQIAQGLKQLEQGISPEVVLTNSIKQLTKRFLHRPTTQLKHAITQDQDEVLSASKYLFDTSETN